MRRKTYIYNDSIEFDEENAIDITNSIKLEWAIKYRDSIKKVLKQGNLYKIYFCFGYTAFGETIRYARNKAEVKWYSKIATEEKEQNKQLPDYIKEFTRNKIYFDGKNIPKFIDKIEYIKKINSNND